MNISRLTTEIETICEDLIRSDVRGLAVEVGFDRISEVRHEILWICEAAHIPVIWAPQVLDTLAKNGLATRAEISHASQGTRAECIMLINGRHIPEAIRMLGTILDRMKAHVSKKKDISGSLDVARLNLRRFYKAGEQGLFDKVLCILGHCATH